MGGHDVAQRQAAGIVVVGGVGGCGQGQFAQGMFAKLFGQRGKGQCLEKERQPGALRIRGVVVQVFADSAVKTLQAAQPGIGYFFKQAPGLHRFVALGLHHQQIPLVQHVVRRTAQRGWQLGAHPSGLGTRQVRAVHAAGTAVQVMRLVHQHTDAPGVELGQAVEHRAAVKVVVVVAHHHIRPAHHLMAEVIGTDRVLQRDCAQALLVQPAALCGGAPGLGQTVIKTLGQWAGLAVAGLVFVFAGFVFGHQLQHPQRQPAVRAAYGVQGIQRHTAPGGLGGEKKQLVDAAFGHGAQCGEHGAYGLANTGGRLRQQGAGLHTGLVHARRQVALAGPERQLWKIQCLQCLIPVAPVGRLALCPSHETGAQPVEEYLQIGGRPVFNGGVFGLVQHVKIDQAQCDVGQRAAVAHQPAIHLELRPVQGTVVGRYCRERAAKGFDFL